MALVAVIFGPDLNENRKEHPEPTDLSEMGYHVFVCCLFTEITDKLLKKLSLLYILR